jgi:putative ABC transport system permease protein
MDFRPHVRARLPPLRIAREPEIVDEIALHLGDLYREARLAGADHETALALALESLPDAADGFARELESASRALPGRIADRWSAAHDDATAIDSTRSWSMFADLRRDVRYAARILARTPGFTLVIVATLALGIGANAVIFSAVDAVLLRRAPVANPSTVVSVYTTSANGRDRFATSSFPDYLDLRGSGVFEDVAAFASIPFVLGTPEGNEQVPGELVTGNYFDVLGVQMALGRGFLPDEDRAASPIRVVVVSHAAWMRRLGRDRGIVGRTLTLNGQTYTVIGVSPRDFTSPLLGRAPEFWAPAALQSELRPPSAGMRRGLGGTSMLDARGLRWLSMIARLKPGSTIEGSLAAADTVSANLERAYPDSNRGRRFNVVPLGEGPGVRATASPLLRLLTAAVAVVLVIACANVASLLLVRAVSRRREVAVRLAVGAGRSRLVRQWLTESALLALLGAAGGLLVARWGAPALHTFGIPRTIELGLTSRVLVFTAAIAAVSAIAVGLAPVIQTLRRNTIEALRDEGGAVASGRHATRMRSVFVVLQVALCVVLLVAAGLFVRTLSNATSVDLGYDVDRVLLADINLDVRGYSADVGQGLYQRLLERLEALPGVEAVGAARITVLSGGSRTGEIGGDGRPVADDQRNALPVRVNVVSEQYLDAMGIHLRAGRGFLSSDNAGAPRVTVISQTLASKVFRDADPLGRTLFYGDTPLVVIGVVPDTVYRSSIERNPMPFLYVPLLQNYESGVTLHIRTSGEPTSQTLVVRRALHEVDPQLVVGRPRVLRDEFDASVGEQRMMAVLVSSFAVLSLLLAAIGLYGVMAHLMGQRTAEIGIRVALGARPASIFRLVLSDGMRLVALGAILGAAGSFLASRYVRSLLFGVEPGDPLTLLLVCIVLLAAAAAACVLPARRAMRVDPALALRGN